MDKDSIRFSPAEQTALKRADSHKNPRRKSKRNPGRSMFIALYLAPALILYAVFVVWPLIQAFQFSMYRWSGLSNQSTMIGLDNFRALAHDDHFWNALKHNIWLEIVIGVLVVILSLVVAHALIAKGSSVKWLRGVILFPQMMSLIVVAILWMFIYNPQFGLLNAIFGALHMPGDQKTWLGKPDTALAAVGIAFAWYAVGFYAMLFAAGLSGIPAEVNEAAELDGAVGLQKFFKVTWANLWAMKRIVAVHLTITVLNVFVLVFIMTSGGPDRATDVLLTYLYERAFTDSNFGYATAIAVANFAVAMVLTLIILKAIGRDPTEARDFKRLKT